MIKVHALVTEWGLNVQSIELFTDLEKARYHMWNIVVTEFDSIEDMNEQWEQGSPDLLVVIWENLEIDGLEGLKQGGVTSTLDKLHEIIDPTHLQTVPTDTCQHGADEDCMICSICGQCREDLDSNDVCMDCGGVDESKEDVDAEKTKMRLGKVGINSGYIVDLDNERMVDEAKDCMYEDICNAVKHNEIYNWIEITKDVDAKESDIPTFLLDDEENTLEDDAEKKIEHVTVKKQ